MTESPINVVELEQGSPAQIGAEYVTLTGFISNRLGVFAELRIVAADGSESEVKVRRSDEMYFGVHRFVVSSQRRDASPPSLLLRILPLQDSSDE